jgi:hypothetical protein
MKRTRTDIPVTNDSGFVLEEYADGRFNASLGTHQKDVWKTYNFDNAKPDQYPKFLDLPAPSKGDYGPYSSPEDAILKIKKCIRVAIKRLEKNKDLRPSEVRRLEILRSVV